MNKREYDILSAILKNPGANQRYLAEICKCSLGTVNLSVKKLINDGYISEDKFSTQKCRDEIEKKRPCNAIILAAGMGMRMVPINTVVPKGLLEVNGEPLIERLIKQLQEAGIRNIYIVVGFLKEKYEYLIDKYKVHLIVNPKYFEKNNLYSLALAVEKIGNTYILPCDIWCRDNPFSKEEFYSWYMVTEEKSKDGFVRVNRKQELATVKDDAERMVGVAYILEKEAEYLKRELTRKKDDIKYEKEFWEFSLLKDGKMIAYARVVGQKEVFEINTYEQLRELDSHSNQLKSEIISVISKVFHVKADEITEIFVLKKGMTNRSFKFKCRGRSYIMRVPGEGTEEMINRKNEYEVYQVMNKTGICDTVRYFSPDKGYKITEYLEDTRVCDANNEMDLRLCMKRLRDFHQGNYQVAHTFDIWERIDYYEGLWNGQTSVYRDYQETKQKVWELKGYIDKQEKGYALTHIDAVPDNFLIKGEEVRLIDWEYAGMQDPHVDIAMFCIYAMYEKNQVDRLIHIYFQGKPDDSIRIKIYCYIAVCGLLWSNWCEYKFQLGVEFGEYSLRQYRYAKEYYKIVCDELGGEFDELCGR